MTQTAWFGQFQGQPLSMSVFIPLILPGFKLNSPSNTPNNHDVSFHMTESPGLYTSANSRKGSNTESEDNYQSKRNVYMFKIVCFDFLPKSNAVVPLFNCLLRESLNCIEGILAIKQFKPP